MAHLLYICFIYINSSNTEICQACLKKLNSAKEYLNKVFQNINIIKNISKMPWYFNFCAPHLPNDSTINFHRFVQTGCLVGFLALYVIIHIYYKLCGPDPQEEKEIRSKSAGSDSDSQNEKGSEQNSENNQEDDKSISIAGGLQQDENSSIGPLDKSIAKKNKKQDLQKKKQYQSQTPQHVTIQQVQQYFPIVFGHFAVACGLTIMYSPYAEQTIGIASYIFFSLILVYVNSKRKTKTTRFVWGFMCLVICFLVMSGLLEVGQANYNKMQNQCFSVGYQALY